jgi:hypothetical protein
MANQYVANTLVGIDFPDDKAEAGVSTAWYEKGEVIHPMHALHLADETLRHMIDYGSVTAQVVREPAEKLQEGSNGS